MKLLVFTSPTCGPCRRQKAEIDEFLDLNPNVDVEVKDVSKEEDLEEARKHNVQRVPTPVLVGEDGQALKANLGVLTADKLKAFVGV